MNFEDVMSVLITIEAPPKYNRVPNVTPKKREIDNNFTTLNLRIYSL